MIGWERVVVPKATRYYWFMCIRGIRPYVVIISKKPAVTSVTAFIVIAHPYTYTENTTDSYRPKIIKA